MSLADSVLPSGTRASRLALATLSVILFLTFLDTTIMSVALYDLQQTLHTTVTDIQWIVNAYALLFASLMLAFGSLGDRIGRRKVMLAGVAVFVAGSVLGALAPNTEVLIAARGIMGIGAAACEPGTLSILRHVYPERRDARPGSRRLGGRGRPRPGYGTGHRGDPGRAWRVAGHLLVQHRRRRSRFRGRAPHRA